MEHEANIVAFWANTVVLGANTVVFLGNTVANTVCFFFGLNQWYLR